MNRKQRRAQQKTAGNMAIAGGVPQLAEANRLNDEALQHHASGRTAEALDLLRRAIMLVPGNALYHNNLGELLRLSGDTDAALASLDRAITLKPDYAQAYNNRGNLMRQLGRGDDAITSYETALKHRPQYPEALSNMAAVLIDKGEHFTAAATLRWAIEINPKIAMLHNNLGIALMGMGDTAAAEAAFRTAAELEPGQTIGSVDLQISLGDLERTKGNLEGALRCYEKAWRLSPGHGEAHLRYGAALMVKGDYAQAWPHFEARWSLAQTEVDKRPFTLPFWKGGPLPAGGRMLLFTEQGVGEVLVLLSLMPELLARGIVPVIECDPRMVPLLQRSFPGLEILARTAPANPRLFEADLAVQATLVDVAAVLRKSPADCRGALPLRADPQRAAQLRNQYRRDHEGPLVGIAWHSGNPKLGAPKSAQLTDFIPFLSLPGCRFVDLQYGNRAADRTTLLAGAGIELIHDADIDQLKDLDAFAAQVAGMDLVISTSNTTAHMAAALGKPTWVLLHKGISPHWYWGLDGERTPWYPTARLLRQREAGDWQGLAEQVATELKAWPASTTS